MCMKILMCGTMVPAEYEVQIEQLSNAGNRFNMNFCKALAEKRKVKFLSYLGMPVKPEVRENLLKEKGSGWETSYFFTSKYKLKGTLAYMRAIKEELKECEYLIAYNAVYTWIFAPIIARRMKKKSVLILADYAPKESYTSKIRKLYASIQLWSTRRYDYVVGLSDNSRLYLKSGQQFTTMEGGIAQGFYDYYATEKTRTDEKVCIQYSGILESITGIDLLIQGFTKIQNPNYILRISGKGALSSWVEEMSKQDARIQYVGCPAYEKYMEGLYGADILANPRNMLLEENAYNFPSKIMEYLATGKRIISTKFPGWERYKEHIEFCESSSEGIQEAIVKVAERIENGEPNSFKERREFATRFIWQKQIQRFLEFVEKID